MIESPLFGRGMGEASCIMIYRFRRDKWVIAMTILAFVILALSLPMAIMDDDFESIPGYCMMGVLCLLLLLTALRSPRNVYIEKDLIIVNFYLGRKVLVDIESVKHITKKDISNMLRIWGNDGFFAYTGLFKGGDIGRFHMLAVNKEELALVTLHNGKKYVINYPSELLEKRV